MIPVSPTRAEERVLRYRKATQLSRKATVH